MCLLVRGGQVVGKHPFVLNAHGAVLPTWRGNYPFYSVLGSADTTESGITIHHVDLGIDTGRVIHVEKCPVTLFDTYESLADKGNHILLTLLASLSFSSLHPPGSQVIGCETRAVPMVLRRLVGGADEAFVAGSVQDKAVAGNTGKGAAFNEAWHQVDAATPLAEAMTKVRCAACVVWGGRG